MQQEKSIRATNFIAPLQILDSAILVRHYAPMDTQNMEDQEAIARQLRAFLFRKKGIKGGPFNALIVRGGPSRECMRRMRDGNRVRDDSAKKIRTALERAYLEMPDINAMDDVDDEEIGARFIASLRHDLIMLDAMLTAGAPAGHRLSTFQSYLKDVNERVQTELDRLGKSQGRLPGQQSLSHGE